MPLGSAELGVGLPWRREQGLRPPRLDLRAVVLFGAASAFLVAATANAGSARLTAISHVGGRPEKILVGAEQVFMVAGGRLSSLDGAEDGGLTQSAAVDLGVTIETGTAGNGVAYLVGNDASLLVVGSTEGRLPAILTRTALTGSVEGARIDAGGGLLCVGQRDDGVSIFDVSDPARPVRLASRVAAGWGVVDVACDMGVVVFVPGGGVGFSVIRDRGGWAEVESQSAPLSVLDVEIHGSRLFVLDRYKGAWLFELDPNGDTAKRFSLEVRPEANVRMAVNERYVLVAVMGQDTVRNGVVLLEHGADFQLREVGAATVGTGLDAITDVGLSADRAFVIGAGFVGSFDVAELALPIVVRVDRILGPVDSLALHDGLLFAAAREAGVRLVSPDAAGQLREVGAVAGLQYPQLVAAAANFVLVADWAGGRSHVARLIDSALVGPPRMTDAVNLVGEAAGLDCGDRWCVVSVRPGDRGGHYTHFAVIVGLDENRRLRAVRRLDGIGGAVAADGATIAVTRSADGADASAALELYSVGESGELTLVAAAPIGGRPSDLALRDDTVAALIGQSLHLLRFSPTGQVHEMVQTPVEATRQVLLGEPGTAVTGGGNAETVAEVFDFAEGRIVRTAVAGGSQARDIALAGGFLLVASSEGIDSFAIRATPAVPTEPTGASSTPGPPPTSTSMDHQIYLPCLVKSST